MLHTKIWSYALDSKHGFGILSNFSANTDSAPCFFEDGTLENVRPSDVYMDNSVNNLLAEGSGRGHYYNAKETRLADTIAAKAVCTFSRGKENSLQAVLSHGSEKVTITVSLQRYSYATSCSCGKPRCIHPLAAGRILNDRINGLIHSYVITDHPVDKSLFLDPELRSAVGSHTEGELSTDLVESILAIIRLVDSAHSGDYYRRFHNFLLDLKPITTMIPGFWRTATDTFSRLYSTIPVTARPYLSRAPMPIPKSMKAGSTAPTAPHLRESLRAITQILKSYQKTITARTLTKNFF